MKLSNLVSELTDLLDLHGEEAEVRLMTQQTWPFENKILQVVTSEDIGTEDSDDLASMELELRGNDLEEQERIDTDALAEELRVRIKDTPAIVYIVEGGQLGYGSAKAWEEF